MIVKTIQKKLSDAREALSIRWRDYRRGYTDADAFSMWDKLIENRYKPGPLIKMTAGEVLAHIDYTRAMLQFKSFGDTYK